MFVMRSLVLYYCRYNVGIFGRRGTYVPSNNAARFPEISTFGGQLQGRHYSLPPPPPPSSSFSSSSSSSIANGTVVRCNKDGIPPPPSQPAVPNPPKNQFTVFINWARWFVGSVLIWFAPFWKKSQEIEDNVEAAVDVVEAVVDVAETVATVTEKVSSEIAENMPENGKLKEVVELVEHISHEAVEDLETAKDIIHKVDELREEVETLLEPRPETTANQVESPLEAKEDI